MNDHIQLEKFLEHFTESQKATIAEMVSSDGLLSGIWEDYIYQFIAAGEWFPEGLQRAIVNRVEEITEDIAARAVFEDMDLDE